MSEREVGVAIKGQLRNLFYDVNVLYLDFINFNILFLISCYSFEKCYHWGKLTKGYMRFPCIIFIATCESIKITKIISFKNNLIFCFKRRSTTLDSDLGFYPV